MLEAHSCDGTAFATGRVATHNPFDEFAKSLVVDRQAFFGHAETECELTRDALYADLAWEPDRNLLLPRRSRDLVDRMARVASLWEFSHCAPDFLTAVTCVEKVCAWHRQRVARAKARRRRAPPIAPLWLICAGTPRKLRLALSFTPLTDWPRGFYRGPEGSALRLVLVRELPVRSDTLLLRLMGAGAVLRRAVAEVEALPDDAEESASSRCVTSSASTTAHARSRDAWMASSSSPRPAPRTAPGPRRSRQGP
ncbi:MAG: hypothetical protein U0326_42620 [Polyangiales bacterium]